MAIIPTSELVRVAEGLTILHKYEIPNYYANVIGQADAIHVDFGYPLDSPPEYSEEDKKRLEELGWQQADKGEWWWE